MISLGKKKDLYKLERLDAPERYEYTLTWTTANQKKKIIKRIESQIRSSMEYRDYITFLKDYMDMRHCAFFNNVTNEGAENRKIKIEVHHDPFTLYELVEVVMDHQQRLGKPLNELYVAEEVMKLHYDNMVGLIPLSKTMHQVVHKSGKIKIPLNLVYGNYKKFMQEYEDDIPDEMWEKLERKMEETLAINSDTFDALQKQYTYIEVDGFSLPKKIEEEKVEEKAA